MRLASSRLGDVSVIAKRFDPGEPIEVLDLLGGQAVPSTLSGAEEAAALSGAPSGRVTGTDSAGGSGAQ